MSVSTRSVEVRFNSNTWFASAEYAEMYAPKGYVFSNYEATINATGEIVPVWVSKGDGSDSYLVEVTIEDTQWSGWTSMKFEGYSVEIVQNAMEKFLAPIFS